MPTTNAERGTRLFGLVQDKPHQRQATEKPVKPEQHWHGDFQERFLTEDDTMSMEELRDYLDNLNNKK